MKILLTGACGLIGSHLAEKLVKIGHEVTGIDNMSYGKKQNISSLLDCNNFNLIEADIRNLDIKKLKELHANFDVLFHLAAYKKSYKSDANLSVVSSDVMLGNSDMAKKIIDLINTYNIPMIYTSTSDVYGNSKNFKEDESLTIGPTNVERYSYAMSKLFEEQLFLNLVNESKIKCAIARIFGCFSERSSKGLTGGHIMHFIDLAISNKDITIHGDGMQTRSMIYVDDIVAGLVAMLYNLDTIDGEIINLGTSEEVSVLDSAKLIISLCNSKSKINFIDGKKVYGDYNEIKRRFANTKKAKNLLGWQCKSNFKESLANVVEIIKKEKLPF
jgi:UDP-glucose 4-epimerase